jgi:hypothetical protein
MLRTAGDVIAANYWKGLKWIFPFAAPAVRFSQVSNMCDPFGNPD